LRVGANVYHRDGGGILKPGDQVKEERGRGLAVRNEAVATLSIAAKRAMGGDTAHVEPTGRIAARERVGEGLSKSWIPVAFKREKAADEG